MWPTILPLFGSAFGSALNFASAKSNSELQAEISRENTDKTIRANREMAELAYKRDLEQWERANKYNDPSSQMSRLRSANLNPMMVYGTGQVAGNTTQTGSPSYQAPTAEYRYQPPQTPAFDMGSVMQMYQNVQLQKAQVDNVKANTKATEQKTINDSIQQVLLAIEAAYGGRKASASTQLLETEAKYKEPKSLAEIAHSVASRQSLEQNTAVSKGMFAVDLAAKQLVNQLKEQEIAKLREDIKTIPLQRSMLSAQKEHEWSKKSLTDYSTQTEIGKQLQQDLQREFDRLRNEMMKEGVTPSDNIGVRMLFKAWEKYFPESLRRNN